MNNQVVTINLVPGLSAPAVVRVSQYDVERPIIFRVLDGNKPAVFPSDCTATIVGTKPSGLGFSFLGTIGLGGMVSFTTNLVMTQERGMIPAEIRFSTNAYGSYPATDIGSANFILAVEQSPHPEGTTDGTQETMQNLETRLQSEINELSDRIDDIEAGGSGLSQTEKNLILTLFSKAAYAESDADVAYEQLESLWATTDKTVTYNLSHVTSSNRATTVAQGASYTTTLTLDTDYTLETIIVKMGGVDITSTAYSSGTISIPSVTGNIVITASAVLVAESITAVYTQSGAVYTTDSLDSLKPDLVVTANYSGGSSEVVTAYTLSGTLTTGTSTITVEYGGLTTTFNVTVSAQPGMDWSSEVPYTVDWGDGGYTLSSAGEVVTSTNTNDHVSGYLDCRGASAIITDGVYGTNVWFYDESKTVIQKRIIRTAIEDPFPVDVPRNAYYCQYNVRSSTPSSYQPIPYLYPKLTENTTYSLNTHYSLEYPSGTEASSSVSNKAFCYGATKLQCSMWERSFIQFYDAEKATLGSSTIRQASATEIDIPSDAYYVTLNPGTIGNSGNGNNPWLVFTA